jgi:hypothetical protein
MRGRLAGIAWKFGAGVLAFTLVATVSVVAVRCSDDGMKRRRQEELEALLTRRFGPPNTNLVLSEDPTPFLLSKEFQPHGDSYFWEVETDLILAGPVYQIVVDVKPHARGFTLYWRSGGGYRWAHFNL